ncbi:carbohydrate kinase [Pontibacter silvestris]|uniref:Carbohydrate kinase n=1 Tax=Pontibacter silvestris TaxID=2305183 RepID=A0ABW4X3K2_9BACT|nr:carbohydrate kinase [Pontibacter silvestris]MCC9134807.1 carbohydrate kinase [Pontibacter silvestris]
MNKSADKSTVVCFGEILWDILPVAAKPGGAPMNVAYHLNKLGVDTKLVSRVGDDEAGEELLNLLKGWGLSTVYCQQDREHTTSEVHVVVDENNEVSYDILYPVAWDYIAFKEELVPLLRNANAFVFGSLITRNHVSHQTLLKMLEISSYNVFDVNLRAPYYKKETVGQLLEQTNLLKLNQAELELVTSWFSQDCTREAERIKLLQDRFQIKEIIVTKGSKGASYYTPFSREDSVAFNIEVADTVGSGDSFLAAFLAKRLEKEHPKVALSYATALAAFVTMHHGACPDYNLNSLEDFKRNKELQKL